jgi:VWFA-related protein
MAKHLPLVMLLALFTALATPSVTAQDQPQRVIINYTTINETADEQGLGLIFTVLDAEGQAVLNPDVSNVNIVLDNGGQVEVLGTSTPDLPFYIALVLDVSGSMQQASATMQTAAITAVNNAPQNTSFASFAVIQFNQQINLLQNFTTDRNAIGQAIGQAKSVPNSGTCLYDAIFTGLEQLNTAPDPARRAVIVFTDGRDEITAGRNDQCSEHSSSEVIDLALNSPQPIPLYTIGLRGDRNINEQELRNFADATGGISAIGDQASLTDLFQQIINSLTGQQLVDARLCSASGVRTATLIVDVGQPLDPDVTRFELETACALATATPPPTITATPRPLQLFIESFSVNLQNQVLSFEIRRTGDIPVAQMRVQIADGATGAVQEQQLIETTDKLVDVVQFPITSAMPGSIEIIASALDANGNVITRQSEEFGVMRPTATPTLRPVQVFIESFSVNLNEERMSFEVRQEGDVPIAQFRVMVNDRRTGILQVERMVEVNNKQPHIIEIATGDLAGGDITIVVNALDADGNVVARQSGEFALLRPTPTPTATSIPASIQIDSVEFNPAAKTLTLNLLTGGASRIEDFRLAIINKSTNLLHGTYSPRLEPRLELALADLEPGEYIVRATIESASGERVDAESEFQYVLLVTPTPVVAAGIRTVDLDGVNNEFVIRIDPQNEETIRAYRVRVVSAESGLLVNEFTTFEVPPYDELRFSNSDLLAGTYNITLFALDANDQTITSSSVEIEWTPPPPPTPTPEPGIVDRASVVLRENPPLAIGVVLIVLVLIATLFVLVRGRTKRGDNWGGGLPAPDVTGVFVAPKAASAPTVNDDRTEIMMPSAFPAVPPAAVFIMKAAAETGMQGQRVNLTLPFSIGRSGSTLNFVNDKSVSRNHALITFEGSHYAIRDQGSGNGTLVDGKRLEPNEQMPLRDGSVIKVGTVNEIRFELGDNSTQIMPSQA